METTGFETNAGELPNNNPFAITNNTTAQASDIISQKSDGLLLNLSDKFKLNGTDLSSFNNDDNFGPETDVDPIDPHDDPKEGVDLPKEDAGDGTEGHLNPFVEHQEKAALEMERSLSQKKEDLSFDELKKKLFDDEDIDEEDAADRRKVIAEEEEQEAIDEQKKLAREETPTPPADAVHDVGGLEEAAVDTESEDEWNYIKGDLANNKENIPPQPKAEAADISAEDSNMSQLNPNAAEFVPVSPVSPVSPTRTSASPACKMLLKDELITQSPSRAVAQEIDISVPNQKDFEREVKSRPSEVDATLNNHDENDSGKPSDLIENILNGKNIDDIPEFHPGSTPKKTAKEEFHFGPNAAPFTPVKLLDQSEGVSTKAIFGDDSNATLGTTLESNQDVSLLNKDYDPMSMSFYADKEDKNPFDLNEVQILPDNIEEFLKEDEPAERTVNNDDAIQTTDLDKHSYDDEKELASPLEPERELLEEDSDVIDKTPEPTHENLLGQEICCDNDKLSRSEVENLPEDVELISPKPPVAEGTKEATEVADLLGTTLDNALKDIELLPLDDDEGATAQNADRELPDLLQYQEQQQSSDTAASPNLIVEHSPIPEVSASPVQAIASPTPEVVVATSPIPEVVVAASPIPEVVAESPIPEVETASPIPEVAASPIPEIAASPIPELAASPIPEVAASPIPDVAASPIPDVAASPIPEVAASPTPEVAASPTPEVAASPIPELAASPIQIVASPVPETTTSPEPSVSPVPELTKSPILQIPKSPAPDVALSPVPDVIASPIPDQLATPLLEPERGDITPDFTREELIDKAEEHFNELCVPEETRPIETGSVSPTAPQEEIVTNEEKPTSMEVASPITAEASYELEQDQFHFSETLPIHMAQGEQIDVKTESITPEFAEKAVVTPSEESRNDDLEESGKGITLPPLEEPPVKIEDAQLKEKTEEKVVAAKPSEAAATTATAKAEPPKKTAGAKKPTTAAKTTSASAKVASKTAAPPTGKSPAQRVGSATKTASPRTSTTPRTSTDKSAAATKLKPSPAASKPLERKPITNGDVPSTARTALAAKKEVASKVSSKPFTLTSKVSSTTTAAKPASARTVTAPKVPAAARLTSKSSTTAKTTTTTTITTAKRPTTLGTSSRTAAGTVSSTTKTTTSTATKMSPRLAPTKPKVSSNTIANARPKVPSAKSTPDAEKQIKESANKITASRNATSRMPPTASARSVTARRIDSKVSSTHTIVSKTTTTVMKSTTAKKPAEIVKSATAKTKTTKIEKPKENGVSTVVTEEIHAVIERDPQLLKDNSPLDNKLVVESLIQTNTIAD